MRLFSSLDFRLYYSGNTVTYGLNQPALSGPPTMSGVQAEIDGNDITFSVNVVGDAAAAIHEVWVTHTISGGASGEWVSLDLVQDPVNSTLWSATLENAVGPARNYVVQAVSGTGLVNIDDNFGAYYKIPAVDPGAPPPEEVEPAPTEIALYAPTIGSYGDEVSVTASLSSELFPVEDANVVFTVGGSGRVARTDASGNATVQLPLTAPPGEYTITASYSGNEELQPASAEALITITPTGTTLSLLFDEQRVGVEGIEPGVTAKLTDESGGPLLQRTVYFTLEGGPEGLITIPVITNNTGVARLPALRLPEGDYSLTARFLGVIPTPDGSLELDDPIYGPSIASGSLPLRAGCEPGALDPAYAPGNKGKGKSKGGATPAVVGFCYLDQDVSGKVTIQDGTLIVGAGTEVGGKIEQFGKGSVVVRPQALVVDKIVEVGPGSVEIFGETADKVEEDGPGDLVIHAEATVAGKAVEAGPGQLTVSGSVGDRVTEQDEGDLVISPTGEVAGKAEEYGPGTVFNDGWVSGPVRED